MTARRIYTLCGRVHLGPCLVNGGPKHNQPICVSCGDVLTRTQRDQIQRTWDTVHHMLRRYKDNA